MCQSDQITLVKKQMYLLNCGHNCIIASLLFNVIAHGVRKFRTLKK